MNRFCALLAFGVAALTTGCQTTSGAPGGGAGGLASALSALGTAGASSPVRDMLEGAAAATRDYSADEQRKLGSDFSAVLLGGVPLLRNDAVQNYVNQVGYWVALQAERPKDREGKDINFAWRFGVMNDDSVGAFATPGGYVFITVGLLRKLNSESELAGVLGHEIAHVVRGHYLAAVKKGGLTQAVSGALQARAGSGAAIAGPVLNAFRNIYSKGLDRADELDADREGVLYATRAGYAPNGLPVVLRMFAANRAAGGASVDPLLSTHPDPTDRANQLEPLVVGKFARTPRVTNENRYAQMKRQLPPPKRP